ncbi:MAG TPA: hypothetical protein VEB70_01725 [Noviherbaspirillum sp.]|nr:hypothetical protein [Noviherbaspirillum sp.]
MNKEIEVDRAPVEEKRLRLNINKLQAALCIALSAVASISAIAWLLT